MELTNEIKGKIIDGIKADRPNYASNAKPRGSPLQDVSGLHFAPKRSGTP